MNLQESEDQPVRSVHLNVGTQPMPNGLLRICSAKRPRDCQNEYGDRCGWWTSSTHLVMAVADGLGHGLEVVETAMACIGNSFELPLDEMFARLDIQLRDTYGVALAVAAVEIDSLCMSIASVGNIRTVLLTDSREYHMPNTSGIVGVGHGQLLSETKVLSPGEVLAVYSDGLDAYFVLRETLETAALFSLDMARNVPDLWTCVGDEAAVLICRRDAERLTGWK